MYDVALFEEVMAIKLTKQQIDDDVLRQSNIAIKAIMAMLESCDNPATRSQLEHAIHIVHKSTKLLIQRK